jgi:hypothetical protein
MPQRAAENADEAEGEREDTVKQKWQFWIGWPVAIVLAGMLPATKYLPESLRLPVVIALPVLAIIVVIWLIRRKP